MLTFAQGFFVSFAGVVGWYMNKMMRCCSSWYIGFFFVIVIGVGIGIMMVTYTPYAIEEELYKVWAMKP